MAQLSAFTPRIAYRVDGCPDPTIEQVVLDTCIELCEQSGILKKTIEPVQTVAGASEFDLDIPSGYKLVRILRVWIDDAEIPAAPEEFAFDPMSRVDSIPGVTANSGTPKYFVEAGPTSIRLYPVPDKAYSVTARVSLKPSRSATAVDDVLFEDWGADIVDGALARLFSMPERWGDKARAGYHQQRFDLAISDAKQESVLGRTVGELRVRPVHI